MIRKQWYKSKTVQSGIGAFLILLGTTGYDIYRTKEITEAQVVVLIGGVATLKGVVDGRANADEGLYTPRGFEGPRKPDNTTYEGTIVVTEPIPPSIAQQPTVVYIEGEDKPESTSNGEFSRLDLPENRNGNYTVTITKDTVIKTSLKDSSLLSNEDFLEVIVGDTFNIDAYDKSEFNHLKAKFLQDGIWYYFFVPHIKLTNKNGVQINLEDRTDEPVVVPIKKTPMNLPGYGTGYLEDPIYPGSNFYWNEFSKNGSRPPESKQQVDNAINIAKLLDKVRSHFGAKPIIITSWFRPYSVNKAVGGASNSQHLYGGAVDFYINGISEQTIYNYINTWHNGGLAIKHGQFCHVDNRNGRTRWNY